MSSYEGAMRLAARMHDELEETERQAEILLEGLKGIEEATTEWLGETLGKKERELVDIIHKKTTDALRKAYECARVTDRDKGSL